MKYRPEVGHRVRALLVSTLYLPPEVISSSMITTAVEGEVVSCDEKRNIIIVRDEDGDWECVATGAFPLAHTTQAPS